MKKELFSTLIQQKNKESNNKYALLFAFLQKEENMIQLVNNTISIYNGKLKEYINNDLFLKVITELRKDNHWNSYTTDDLSKANIIRERDNNPIFLNEKGWNAFYMKLNNLIDVETNLNIFNICNILYDTLVNKTKMEEILSLQDKTSIHKTNIAYISNIIKLLKKSTFIQIIGQCIIKQLSSCYEKEGMVSHTLFAQQLGISTLCVFMSETPCLAKAWNIIHKSDFLENKEIYNIIEELISITVEHSDKNEETLFRICQNHIVCTLLEDNSEVQDAVEDYSQRFKKNKKDLNNLGSMMIELLSIQPHFLCKVELLQRKRVVNFNPKYLTLYCKKVIDYPYLLPQHKQLFDANKISLPYTLGHKNLNKIVYANHDIIFKLKNKDSFSVTQRMCIDRDMLSFLFSTLETTSSWTQIKELVYIYGLRSSDLESDNKNEDILLKLVAIYSFDFDSNFMDYKNLLKIIVNAKIPYIKKILNKIHSQKYELINLLIYGKLYSNFECYYQTSILDKRGRIYERFSIFSINKAFARIICKPYIPVLKEKFDSTAELLKSIKANVKILQWLPELNAYEISKEYILSYFKKDPKVEFIINTFISSNNTDYNSLYNLREELSSYIKKPIRLFYAISLINILCKYTYSNNYPISFFVNYDSTTSGYQMMAMLFNNKKLAKLSNLVGDTYHDIYKEFANRFKSLLENVTSIVSFSEIKQLDYIQGFKLWAETQQQLNFNSFLKTKDPKYLLHIINTLDSLKKDHKLISIILDRTFWKNSLMTYPYRSTRFSRLNENHTHLQEELKIYPTTIDFKSLLNIVDDFFQFHIKDLDADKLFVFTDFLIQEQERKHKNLDIDISNDLFTIILRYRKRKKLIINSKRLRGTRQRSIIYTYAKESDRLKTKNAIGANIIHSMDARFMHEFLRICSRIPEFPIYYNHDCFGFPHEFSNYLKATLIYTHQSFRKLNYIRFFKHKLPSEQYAMFISESQLGTSVNPHCIKF